MSKVKEFLFQKGDKTALIAPSSSGKSYFLAKSILLSSENQFATDIDSVVIVGRGCRKGEIARHLSDSSTKYAVYFFDHCPKPESVEHMATSGHLCMVFEDPMLYSAEELRLFRQYWLKYCNALKITSFCTLQGIAGSTKVAFWKEIVLNSNFLIFLDALMCNVDLKKISKIMEPSSKSDFLCRCLRAVTQLPGIKRPHLVLDFKNTGIGFKIRTLFYTDQNEKIRAYGFRKNREI